MSGTSLDGLDIVMCTFSHEHNQFTYTIHDYTTVPYPDHLQEQLKQAWHMSAYDYVKLDKALGTFFGQECNVFIGRQQPVPSCIASHGHTVFHDLEQQVTSQIGHGATLAASTSLPVICDFRSMDIALGGQGAPLVPVGDHYLFGSYEACLNLGGIANISYIKGGQRRAYDICGVNMVLNALAQQAGLPYDEGGRLAASGRYDEQLANALNALPFYTTAPPKSLGVEWVNREVMPLLSQSGLPLEDQLHTYTRHVAHQLAKAIATATADGEQTLITGGGAHNTYLIDCLRQATGDRKMVLPEKAIIDYKEAIIFAFLGYLRLFNHPNCLKTVTGASENSVGGVIYGAYP